MSIKIENGQVWTPTRGIFKAEVLDQWRRQDGVAMVKVRKFGGRTQDVVVDMQVRTLRGDYVLEER